jgi:hypothetical protein
MRVLRRKGFMKTNGGTRRRGGGIDRVGGGNHRGNIRTLFGGFGSLSTVQKVSTGSIREIIHDSSPSASRIEQPVAPGSFLAFWVC